MRFEHQLIQATGFRNYGPRGAREGFEIRLRVPNYRGMRLSLLDGVDVTVDNEFFSFEVTRLRLQGAVYDLAAMRDATTVRWSLEDHASVLVTRAGGLAPGIHDVRIAARVRSPYFPPQLQPLPVHAHRKATIVLP